ncbi:MAG: NAD(P)-binding domain-containing protein [Bacteroidales bacterium]|nr:NAD(P)-binding domain-containing protein [Bacteroidales bacterium]
MNTFFEGKKLQYAVIGSGSWATALVKLLSDTKEKLYWYVRNENNIEHIKLYGRNRNYLRSAALFPEKLIMTDDINEVVAAADIIIFCIPSTYFISQINNITVSLDNKYIVSAIKGLVSKDNMTIAEYFNSFYNIPYDRIAIISGPTHAEEIAMERLSYLTVSSKYSGVAELISEAFTCHYVKTIIGTDIYGVEYSAAMKNIYAVAVGVCHSLGYGDNFVAVLVTSAYNEMVEFLDLSHPDKDRIPSRSAYLGDLLVTCYSQFSRNRTFGGMIGKGYSVISAHTEMNMIAEGYYATKGIYEISKKLQLDLPIVEAMYKILYEDKYPDYVIKQLADMLK